MECHNTHTQQVDPQVCADCHEGVDTLEAIFAIRMSEVDYDGDGDVTEGLYGEIATMRDALYAAMQQYTANNGGTAVIIYNPNAYPYYFADDGTGNPGENYSTWTPNLLRAAYNYQYSQKDPGAFAHNGKYLIQILYDSIKVMGGDVSGMTRP